MSDRRHKPFIRLDMLMPDHPKIEGLSDGAFRLLIRVWCRCAVMQSDGVVTDVWWRRQPARARAELISNALVVQIDDKWLAHDYLDHQESRAQIEAKRVVRAQAGRAGGLAKAKQIAKQTPGNLPSKNVPEVEVEEEVEEEEEKEPLSAPPVRQKRTLAKTHIPPTFEVTLALREWARSNGIDANLTAETQQWLDYHNAKHDTAADWTASWRYWMRNTKKFGSTTPTKKPTSGGDW